MKTVRCHYCEGCGYLAVTTKGRSPVLKKCLVCDGEGVLPAPMREEEECAWKQRAAMGCLPS